MRIGRRAALADLDPTLPGYTASPAYLHERACDIATAALQPPHPLVCGHARRAPFGCRWLSHPGAGSYFTGTELLVDGAITAFGPTGRYPCESDLRLRFSRPIRRPSTRTSRFVSERAF
jgi:hypothetical protein